MKNKSFTLIELLVVIVIIGILAGVIIVSVSSSINKANFAKAQSFSNTVQNELLGDLVSEWTFNSPAVSGKTEDSWGNNDGTLYGANGLPQLQTKENCVYGTCYLFDGVDDYIDCGDAQSRGFPLENLPRTIAAWFKKNTSSLDNQHTTIVGWGNGAVQGYMSYLEHNYNKLFFFAYSTPDVMGTTVLQDDVWYFGVMTHDGAETKLYLNGFLENKKSSVLETKNSNVYIGKIAKYFSGYIDDVRIYNGAISSSQIKQQYVAGLNSLLANNNISNEEYLSRIENLSLND